MRPLRQTASLLLAIVLFVGLAGNLQAREEAPEAETPLMQIVNELLGIRYKYGGSSTKGFDCSGFTSYVFEHLIGEKLNRRSIDQATQGVKVAKADLREGDLVFFKTNGKSISHVGIYVGDGKFAHASTKNGIVIIPMTDSYYAKRYVTARRILTDEQYLELASREEAERRLAEALAAEEAARHAEGEEAAEGEPAAGEEATGAKTAEDAADGPAPSGDAATDAANPA